MEPVREVEGQPKPSVMMERLLEIGALGLPLSAVMIQWVADGAVIDGLQHPEVVEVSKFGASGKHPGNIRRELYNKYGKDNDFPPPVRVKDLPYIEQDSAGKDVVKHINYPMFNPCAMFDTLANKYPRQFAELLAMGPETFWQSVRPDDPKLFQHPMCEENGWKKRLFR